jgi:hypothetical protein
MTTFPATLDTFTDPQPTDQTSANGGHAAQHANANDAIAALETKVGITTSLDTTSFDYRIAQLEAALGGYNPATATFRVVAGKAYFKNPNTSLWRQIIPIINEDGAVSFDISQSDVA